jgi:nitronate monooxygenase
MLRTFLTETWTLTVPIIGAPMSPMAGGRLAAAISRSGGLGMIGVSSTQPAEQLEKDVAEFRSLAGDLPFGIGLMTWALDARADLFEATLAARPFAVAMSFGDPARFMQRLRDAKIRVLAQVQDGETARIAEKAGVDVLVAQGAEAGGHTGGVGTLPLLQVVLRETKLPVVAAGGVATGRGLAAVLAAGAQGAWIGTPFLVAEEARNSGVARQKILQAKESDTVHTHVFDVVQKIPWPAPFPGRALANEFTARWHGHEAELDRDEGARQAFQEARKAEEYSRAYIYAGQSVGVLDRIEPAAAIVERIAGEGEAQLRAVNGMLR